MSWVTQQGNNNAYCQTHRLGAPDTQKLTDQTDHAKLLQLRGESAIFRPTALSREFLLAKGQSRGRKNIAWFGGNNADDQPEARRHATHARHISRHDNPDRATDEAFLIWFHAGSDAIQVDLPNGPWAETYSVIAHTGLEGELPSEKIAAGSSLQLPARTVVVLQVD
jgi:glycogen operon protein